MADCRAVCRCWQSRCERWRLPSLCGWRHLLVCAKTVIFLLTFISKTSISPRLARDNRNGISKTSRCHRYFAQRLSELGVDVPIGIANTAIGGQRIEE
jgi:hypothetical protein